MKPTNYYIAWERNTNQTRYVDGSESGTSIMENATVYDSKEEAQKVIDANEWTNCYVVEDEPWYELVNQQTGEVEFTGLYDECLSKREDLIIEEKGQLSTPDLYYKLR